VGATRKDSAAGRIGARRAGSSGKGGAACRAGRQARRPAVVVPVDNLAEASLVEGVEVWGVRTLGQLHQWLTGSTLRRRRRNPLRTSPMWWARFAVEVAAAGAHHLMMTGPPGVGKTLLVQRLPGLLPPLSEAKSLEVTAICQA